MDMLVRYRVEKNIAEDSRQKKSRHVLQAQVSQLPTCCTS